MVDVAQRFEALESPVTGSEEESSYEDPVSEAEHAYLQREAFDAVEDGGDAGCDRVSDAPAIRAISLDDLRRRGRA